MNSKEINTIVKKYLASLKKGKIPISKAYLFGSYAQNNPQPWSDIDICIISPYLAKNKLERSLELWDYIVKIDSRLEPIGYFAGRIS